MFSARTRWDLLTNRLSATVEAKRRSGAHGFYETLGFEAAHWGYKLSL